MKVGIIGCGNMGSAIAKGILSKKILSFSNIYISDKDSSKTKELHKKFGIRIASSEDVVKKSDIIIIAVKPQDCKKLLKRISSEINTTKHIISVMAGITISRIECLLKKKVAITRAMPNMAALVGKSITCISYDKNVKNKIITQKIFSSIGEILEIDEKKMDAVTAISGSGPAYFFYLAECLSDAAVNLGIRKEKALQLAVSTLVGSGALLDSFGLKPEALRKSVTSKRGTTEKAISVLKSNKIKDIMMKATKEAAKRAKELSKGA